MMLRFGPRAAFQKDAITFCPLLVFINALIKSSLMQYSVVNIVLSMALPLQIGFCIV
jgi:hypothetical protein